MKLLTRRLSKGHKTTRDVDPGVEGQVEDQGSDEAATASSVAWTCPAAWVTKGISAGLIACLVAGPCALLLGAWLMLSMTSAPAPTAAVSTEAESVDERAAVETFAADFVVTWLTTVRGEEQELAPFLSSTANVTLPEQAWRVQGAAPAGIVEVDGVWSVTVAATVAESDTAPTTRRYFQVPIVYDAGAMVAQTLPGPVAEPLQAAPLELGYRFQAGLSDPVAVAAGEFLTALLVGGEVTRVISPDADIRALTPPPYTSVELEEVRSVEDLTDLSAGGTPSDGEQLHLLATAAVAPRTAASTLTIQYALTMTARAGRWEVSAIDAAPSRAPQDPDVSGTTNAPTPDAPSAGIPSGAPSSADEADPDSDDSN